MRTIIELKPINPLLRMFTILYFVPLIIFFVFIKLLITSDINSGDTDIFMIILIAGTLFMFFRDFYSLKFYLINISITDDNMVYLQYYEWFFLKENKIPKNELRFIKEQIISLRLRILVNNKLFIKQYEGTWWALDKWTRPMLTDVYEKMKIELNHTK